MKKAVPVFNGIYLDTDTLERVKRIETRDELVTLYFLDKEPVTHRYPTTQLALERAQHLRELKYGDKHASS